MWRDNDGGIDMNSEREVILMYSHRENVITYDCESVEHASDLFVQVAERLVPCSSNCLPPVTLFCAMPLTSTGMEHCCRSFQLYEVAMFSTPGIRVNHVTAGSSCESGASECLHAVSLCWLMEIKSVLTQINQNNK